jgi:hypothetical protein
LTISIPEVIAVPPSELNAVPIVDSINGNQPDGIAIQIDHPTGSRISPEFYQCFEVIRKTVERMSLYRFTFFSNNGNYIFVVKKWAQQNPPFNFTF